jgi:hypothetical protein
MNNLFFVPFLLIALPGLPFAWGSAWLYDRVVYKWRGKQSPYYGPGGILPFYVLALAWAIVFYVLIGFGIHFIAEHYQYHALAF